MTYSEREQLDRWVEENAKFLLTYCNYRAYSDAVFYSNIYLIDGKHYKMDFSNDAPQGPAVEVKPQRQIVEYTEWIPV